MATAIERLRVPSDPDLLLHRPSRASTGFRVTTLNVLILVSFLLGVAASHIYGQYARHVDCQRWQENVNRWVQVVSGATGELTQAETVALQLAHGGMIAVRDQVCGR